MKIFIALAFVCQLSSINGNLTSINTKINNDTTLPNSENLTVKKQNIGFTINLNITDTAVDNDNLTDISNETDEFHNMTVHQLCYNALWTLNETNDSADIELCMEELQILLKFNGPLDSNNDDGDKIIDHNSLDHVHIRDKRYYGTDWMYSGTLWCADDSTTSNPDSLGRHTHIDKCCRDHHLCTNNEQILAESERGVTLSGKFRSCYCDVTFYRCLQNLLKQRPIFRFKINAIGNKYFNDLAPKCVMYDHPHVECSKLVKWRYETRCSEYVVDTDEPLTAEIIDNAFYT